VSEIDTKKQGREREDWECAESFHRAQVTPRQQIIQVNSKALRRHCMGTSINKKGGILFGRNVEREHVKNA
jgi:hypothetical protein